MPGPPKTPLEERRRKGRSPGRDSGGRALPDPENVIALHGVDGGLPATPATVAPDGPGAGRWRRIWGECTWLSPQTDLDVVTRLCESEDLYAGMKAALAEEGFYVTGSMGQKRTNPLLGDLRATADQMLKLEKELGLTPAARGSMGVAEVKASAVVENNPLADILTRAAGRGRA